MKKYGTVCAIRHLYYSCIVHLTTFCKFYEKRFRWWSPYIKVMDLETFHSKLLSQGFENKIMRMMNLTNTVMKKCYYFGKALKKLGLFSRHLKTLPVRFSALECSLFLSYIISTAHQMGTPNIISIYSIVLSTPWRTDSYCVGMTITMGVTMGAPNLPFLLI